MNISPEDPRLTAFALGEIDDPVEAKQIEEAVAASPELRETVESIRATAGALVEAFAAEPAPALSRSEQAALYPDTRHAGRSSRRARLFLWPSFAAAVAAAIALVAVVRDPAGPPAGEIERHASAPAQETAHAHPEFPRAGERASETKPLVRGDAREFGDFSETETAGLEQEIATLKRSLALMEPESEPDPKPRLPERRRAVARPKPPLQPAPPAAPAEALAMADTDAAPYAGAVAEDRVGAVARERAEAIAGPTDAEEAEEIDTRSLEARIRELLRIGRAHYINGDLDAAEQTFRELLAIDPGNAEAEALLEHIANERLRRERLDRDETRTKMLESVSTAWQRPSVYVDRERVPARLPPAALARRLPDDFRGRTAPWNVDAYDPIEEAGFRSPLVAPLSTFSIDVDTASYAHVRSYIDQGRLPPASAVRVEEFINYFPYADAPPGTPVDEGGDPFAVRVEQAAAPWAPDHRLLRVNLKGYEIPWNERPASNLVFLIDVSGSMNRPNRLPLVKDALGLLVDRLDERDRVAIVVYAGASNLALPSTTANNRETIRYAIDQLVAQGSTHASDGIQRAYETARKHFIADGNNRVILCTDGDFNVGITDRGKLGEFVAEQADKGVSLAVLGFGMGNYKDNMLEHLSTKGRGVYAYIDSETEARKFFLQQLASNLFTIAHDVRIQVELNPAEVAAYRLIGYENRLMRPEDFNDDTKRAGQIGPGHTVTAFYEIVPAGAGIELAGVDPLRYQTPAEMGMEVTDGGAGELATVKVRYKRPGEDASELIVAHVQADGPPSFESASPDFRFGAAAAAFGMRLRESEYIRDLSWEAIRRIALDALGDDPGGHRTEFISLVERAEKLAKEKTGEKD